MIGRLLGFDCQGRTRIQFLVDDPILLIPFLACTLARAKKMALIWGDQGRFHARKTRFDPTSGNPATDPGLDGHAVLGVEKSMRNLACDQEQGSPDNRDKKGELRRDASGIVGQEPAHSATHVALSI